jgi:hypothetical protein
VASVEADRDPQDRGERPDQRLIGLAERGELGVRRLRAALSVVPGDLGDELDLVVGEPGQLAVADDVVRVQVVLRVGHHQADVRQHGPRFEVVARPRTEPVHGPQPVEQRDGEPGDLGRVRGIVVAPVLQLSDAAP